MPDTSKGERSSFAAHLITRRTILIFAAGFLLALFLARLFPGVELFHPEGPIFTRDAIITGATRPDSSGDVKITTSFGYAFEPPELAWDGDLLRQVRALAPGPMTIPARISYVIPREGVVSALSIERAD